MKILCAGDQHITNRRPKNRTDDYFKTVLYKFKQEMQITQEEGCEIVLLPGDVFDTYKENHLVVQSIIDIINEFPKILVLCVAGQHDQQFHNNDLTGTALQTLISAGVMFILTDKPYRYHGVDIYGSSWKCEVPVIQDKNQINILVLHKMIVDEKLWAQQECHTWANHFLLKNKYDLIVSGDNHQQFSVSKGSQHLVNMGSMMRSTIAQINHHPAVTIYDTAKGTIDILDLDYKPADEIMQIEKATKEKEKNAQLDAFVASLKGDEVKEGHAVKLNFVEALGDYIERNKVDSGVADIIYECVEE